MNSLRALILACAASAVGGGLIGGFVVSLLAEPNSEARVESEPVGSKEYTKGKRSDHGDGDSSDLTRLEARIAELQGQLSALDRRQRSRQSLEALAEKMKDSDAEEGGGKGGAPPRPPADSADPAFELAVRSVLDRVDWEREEEERVTRAQRRSERAERQTALLTERLGLTDEQATNVAAALARQMERFRSLREGELPEGEARPESRSEWRERTQKIRDQTEQELGEILDERQMKDYRAFAEEEGLGPGWGRRERRGESRPPQ